MVGDQDGLSVGVSEGEEDGSPVEGSGVATVGYPVGLGLGSPVGASVGSAVGSAVTVLSVGA